LPRTPREKSYSPRISGSAALSVAFFIALSFTPARLPGADDANIIAPFRMDNNQQFPLV